MRITKKEIWKNIAGYDGYQISNLGKVRRMKRKVKSAIQKSGYRVLSEKMCAILDNGKGYKLICCQINGHKKNLYLHRLVALHFIPNPDNLPEVNHKDCNKANNRFNNLEWMTPEMNKEHAKLAGVIARGERITSSKLKESQVIDILNRYYDDPNFNSRQVAKEYGLWDTAINRIVKGKRWAWIHDKWAKQNESRLTKI